MIIKLFVPLTSFFLLACSSEPAFDACGGDPVGRWSITGSEVDDQTYSDARCAGMRTVARLTSLTGELLVTEDGNYETSSSVVWAQELTVPLSCLPGPEFCEEFALAFTTVDSDAACEFAGGRCVCQYEIQGIASARGTYERTGDGVMLFEATDLSVGGDSQATPPPMEVPFCVVDNGLSFYDEQGDMVVDTVYVGPM